MKIRNIKEAELALRPYVPLVSQLTGRDTTLKRIRPLMKLLGNPHERLKIVHIAGTSGKTSTSYYCAALIHETGQSVGLTVSPHVDTITERVQINGKPISDGEFCQNLTVFLDIVEQALEKPSYFELLYAFALWMFDRFKVQYAVVETGMGGLHDATNIAERSDKVCVITDIGFDHMHILGNTIPEIALQKIGIVHEGNTVCMFLQSNEIMDVVKRWTSSHHASLQTTTEIEEQNRLTVNMSFLPLYQQRNWLLARYVIEYLGRRDHLSILNSDALARTMTVQVPGRMDTRVINRKTVVMDGAHNEQKMMAFIESFKKLYPDVRPAVLIAMKQGKEYEKVVPQVKAIASRVIITTFDTSQDLPVRSVDPNELAAAFVSSKTSSVEVIQNSKAALKALLNGSEEVCIVTGSFYLLSQIRKSSPYNLKS
jgi:dihydrofolate synthase/folylpolyglutamate synthase